MRYLNFWFESFKISFKQSVEFKSNFYSALLINISYFFVIALFSLVFTDVIGENINWGFSEFILFGFLLNFLFDVTGFFWYGYYTNLPFQIKTGNINSYLTKPGNQFFLFLFRSRYNPIVFIVFDLILFIPYLIYLADYNILNVLFGILILFFLIFFSILLIQFLMSFSWIFVELGGFLTGTIYWNFVQENLRPYPFQMFSQNEQLFSFLKFLPMFYVSILLAPIISFGDYSGISQVNYLLFLILIPVLVIGLIFNWKHGLKNYEAYG